MFLLHFEMFSALVMFNCSTVLHCIYTHNHQDEFLQFLDILSKHLPEPTAAAILQLAWTDWEGGGGGEVKGKEAGRRRTGPPRLPAGGG